ncbi:ABC transporter substrate-binding protein [Naasia lichenicola]|uniref:ABC transporter substrate-binding protein n=1 Tax=Naasia lichenicola TaxID=2565933 RepID=A0A4S4FJ35_9MICO|nr:ABC transporter substrate-binding protein [Naasia lichenicola]THG30098.1 ABC transporter substrate-binding protein [Naasia lichenicola]
MTATTLRFAGGAQGFNWLPVFVAEERGLFAARGLNVELLRLGSVEKATSAVRDGSADLAITPPEGAIADYLAGGSLRVIASNSERLPMSLVARPGITELVSLRGKRIGTSSLTEGTSMYTRRMLAAVGLHYPADYDFVFAGVHTGRWAALQNDEIDAAPQPAPWNFLAERAGYEILGEVADTLPEIVFAGVIGSAPWLDDNGDTVGRLVAALSEAHDFVNDPANDGVSVPIYQRVTTPDDPELARRGFEYTRDLGMWPAGLRVSADALTVNIDVMIEAGLMSPDQRAAAAGVFDPRFTEIG